MIEINLVPEHLRKKRRAKTVLGRNLSFALPQEAVIGLIAGAVILLLFVHITLQFFIVVRFVQLKGLRHKTSGMSTEKANVDGIVQELKRLQDKYKSVEKIAGGKDISWAKILNQISDSIPRGVWLNRMALNETTLMIQGSAVSKSKAEMINVHNFTTNLKADKEFMSSFSDLELGIIKSRMVGQTPIADFTIRADLKGGTP